MRGVTRGLTLLAALISIASGGYMVLYQEKSSSVPAAFDVLLNGIGGYFVAIGLFMVAWVLEQTRGQR
jgi:hypothetical protein